MRTKNVTVSTSRSGHVTLWTGPKGTFQFTKHKDRGGSGIFMGQLKTTDAISHYLCEVAVEILAFCFFSQFGRSIYVHLKAICMYLEHTYNVQDISSQKEPTLEAGLKEIPK